MAKKVTHKFKTKRRDGKTYMICRNSIPNQKYWAWQFLADKPRCNEWSEVGEGTTAVLCYKCVAQTVGPPEIKGGYVSKGRPRGWQSDRFSRLLSEKTRIHKMPLVPEETARSFSFSKNTPSH